MAKTERIRVPSELIGWLSERYKEQLYNQYEVYPSKTFLLKIAYYKLLSYETGKEFEIYLKKKCYKIREVKN